MLKKIILIVSMCIMFGCSSLQEEKEIQIVPIKKTDVEMINLDNNEVLKILSFVSNNLKSDSVYENSYEGEGMYKTTLGKYIVIPINSEFKYTVTEEPIEKASFIKIKDEQLFFRSIYQGTFKIAIHSGENMSQIIIKNKLNYQFTEENIFYLISTNFENGDLKNLENTAYLYRMVFPRGEKNKEISLMLMDLASKEGNSKVVNNELKFLEKQDVILTSDEKEKILSMLSIVNSQNLYLIPTLLDFDIQNENTKAQILSILSTKTDFNEHEIEYLEKYFNSLEVKDKNLQEMIGKWYMKNGNTIKGNRYLESLKPTKITTDFLPLKKATVKENIVTTEVDKNYKEYLKLLNDGKNSLINENYLEASVLFEKAIALNEDYPEQKELYKLAGDSYFKLKNYENAISFYEDALKLETNTNKLPEIYYNLGVAYDKVGNKEKAKQNLTYLKQKFNGTTWGVKSSLYLLQEMK